MQNAPCPLCPLCFNGFESPTTRASLPLSGQPTYHRRLLRIGQPYHSLYCANSR